MKKMDFWKEYNKRNVAHVYVLGFALKGRIFAVRVNAETCAEYVKLDKASRGAGLSLRFKPNTGDKLDLLTAGEIFELCSVAVFKALVAESKYNKGEIFEMLITEHFGQTWVKDNVPFTEAGDINVDGTEIQIKFEGATFCTEKQILRLKAEDARPLSA